MNYKMHNTMRRTPETNYLCGVHDAPFALRALSFTWF